MEVKKPVGRGRVRGAKDFARIMLVLPDRHTKILGMGRGCGGLLEQHLHVSGKPSGALRPDKPASLLRITCLHSNTSLCKLLVKTSATDEYTLTPNAATQRQARQWMICAHF